MLQAYKLGELISRQEWKLQTVQMSMEIQCMKKSLPQINEEKRAFNKYSSILQQIHKIRVGLICQATV